MRRLICICLFVAIVPWIVIGIVRESNDNDKLEHYFVRAVFDNAANLVQDEDVKIAGVVVGVVQGTEVTDDKKAAVTLRIDNEDFTPWKTDATCTIRPQSPDRREVRGVRAGLGVRRAARADRGRATARASGCCRWRTPARRSTSTCSTTSCGCPTASASRCC